MAGTALIGIGLGVGGQVFQAFEMRRAGLKAQRRGEQIARQILADAEVEVQLRRLRGRRLGGVQKSRIAAANIRVDRSSALELAAENVFITEFAVERIRERARRLAQQVKDEGRAIKRQLRAQAISSALQSTGSTLTGGLFQTTSGQFGSSATVPGTRTTFGPSSGESFELPATGFDVNQVA